MRSVITEAKVTKRYNTGDYEFEEFTLGAIVDEKESGAEVLAVLKSQINEAFVGEVAAEKTEPKTAAKPAKKKEEKKNAKSKSSKASAADDEVSDGESDDEEDSVDATESDADDEAADSDDSDSDDDSADDAEDADEDTKEEPKKGSKPSKSGKAAEGKSGKSFKKKPQVYNRSIEQHKEIFSGVLRSVSPEWKKSDKTKELAKKASVELEGENFLDENGEVLPQFKVQVTRIFKGKTK